MKRILSSLLAAAMTLSLLPATVLAADVEKLTDVSKDAWYYEYVDFVVDEEYFVGTSETTFSPNMTMTRAMFATVLAAVEGVKVNNNQSPFADVPAGQWYSGAVAWAKEHGVVAGTGDNKFNPNGEVNREQIATMMNAYVLWADGTHKVNTKVESFVDAAQISDWATKAVDNCRNWGLIAGNEKGEFMPKKDATRAEVATMVSQLAFMLGGGGGSAKPYDVWFYLTKDAAEPFAIVEDIASRKTVGDEMPEDPTQDGFTFVRWNNWKDEEFDADTKVNATLDKMDDTVNAKPKADKVIKVYASWTPVIPVVPETEDLILNAIRNAVAYLNDEIYDVDKDNDDDMDASYEGSSIVINGVKLDEENRGVNLEAVATAQASTVKHIVTTAVREALALYRSPTTQEDVTEFVKDVIAEIENYLGVNITRNNATEIAKDVFNQLKAEVRPIRAELADCFKIDGEYVMGDITVSVGDASVVIDIDDNATLVGGKRENAVKMAVAIAKDLYADLKAVSSYTTVDEIVLDATMTVDFAHSDNEEFAKNTKEYPTKYTQTLSMNLAGNMIDNVAYYYNKAENVHYVELQVTEKMQTAYNAYAQQTFEYVMGTQAVKNAMDQILSEEKVDKMTEDVKKSEPITGLVDTLTDLYVTPEKNETVAKAEAEEKVFTAIDNWVDVNVDTNNLANNALIQHWLNPVTDVEKYEPIEANEPLYTLAQDVATESIDEMIDSYGLTPGSGMAQAATREELKDILSEKEPDMTAALEDMGMLDYAVALAVDKLTEGSKPVLPEDIKGMQMALDKAIFDAAFGSLTGTKQTAPAAQSAIAMAALDARGEGLMASAKNVDLATYLKYLAKAELLMNIDTMADLRLGNLATALRNQRFQNFVGNRGNNLVARFADTLRFIPDEASVTIDGVVISEETLADVRDAKTTIELCNAVAAVIEQLGDLTLNSFADPVMIEAAYMGANHQYDVTVGLTIDIQ